MPARPKRALRFVAAAIRGFLLGILAAGAISAAVVGLVELATTEPGVGAGLAGLRIFLAVLLCPASAYLSIRAARRTSSRRN